MPTQTTNYGFDKPLVNSATDQDLWGGYLNDDMDDLDGLIKTSFNWTPSAKTASFSVTGPTTGSTTTGDARKLFLCDATSGTITASLPAAASNSGMPVAFKKTDAGANTVILDGNASETIDGSTTYTISTQNTGVVIVSDGTNWKVLADNTNVSALAPLASPTFTGVPAAPTAAAATSTTQLATTAFVNATALTLANGTTAATQSVGDNTTKVATTAFVIANGALMTALGVGSIIVARYNPTGSPIAANATTAASNLTCGSIAANGGDFASSGDSLTGTWKALQTVDSTSTLRWGLFQRTV